MRGKHDALRYLTRDEAQRLIADCSPRIQPIVTVALQLGGSPFVVSIRIRPAGSASHSTSHSMGVQAPAPLCLIEYKTHSEGSAIFWKVFAGAVPGRGATLCLGGGGKRMEHPSGKENANCQRKRYEVQRMRELPALIGGLGSSTRRPRLRLRRRRSRSRSR